ncbi:unnamed protein product [Prorocentrum cordatum]|uniref:Cysteine dioxygenase n=1 Tax=Prorocentrum cordatum TaxID=2364126 RepID=A0ABN9Q7D7_9DINO|nr:unnamed protein product [Polarella glacialis]
MVACGAEETAGCAVIGPRGALASVARPRPPGRSPGTCRQAADTRSHLQRRPRPLRPSCSYTGTAPSSAGGPARAALPGGMAGAAAPRRRSGTALVPLLAALCGAAECLSVGGGQAESHVYVEPQAVAFSDADDTGAWQRKVLVADGRGVHMGELAIEQLAQGAKADRALSAADTQLYFGLGGQCTVAANGETAALARGVSVLVRPGTRHSLVGSDHGPPCQVLSVGLHSGSWLDGARGPALRRADDGQLPSEKTAHESALLSKRVHARRGLVPGLMQLSVARFQPRAECELHRHATGTEVYVNYGGKGCHLTVLDDSTGARRNDTHDISGGIVDVINPGSWHEAWNDAQEHCENINMLLADPRE